MFKATPTAPIIPAVLVFAALAASSAMGQFHAIERLPGGGSTVVRDLSADGEVATGAYTAADLGFYGFTWTPAGGRHDLATGQGGPLRQAPEGISGDGRIVVGSIASTDSRNQAFRWSEDGGFEALGAAGWAESFATDTNADGSVIIGELHDEGGNFYQPFRWTQSGGFEILRTRGGGLINANFEAVSDDGSIAVGTDIFANRAFSWTASNGYTYLDSVPGTNGTTSARGVSRDGRYIVGLGGFESFGVLWTPTEVLNLGKLAGFRSFLASEVSDSGDIVAGTSGSNVGRNLATVWTEAGGLQSLADYLAAQGVTVPMNVRLESCTGISGDGLTFAGTATMDGQASTAFGYVVSIPAPATACTFLGLFMFCRRKRGEGVCGLSARHRVCGRASFDRVSMTI